MKSYSITTKAGLSKEARQDGQTITVYIDCDDLAAASIEAACRKELVRQVNAFLRDRRSTGLMPEYKLKASQLLSGTVGVLTTERAAKMLLSSGALSENLMQELRGLVHQEEGQQQQ